MDSIEITDFEAFSRALRGLWVSHFVYRGEDADSYPLLSKFGRAQMRDARNAAGVERGLFLDFVRLSTPHFERQPRNEWEWLALAQHHGLATRLLDWTENPLIAAYFATRGPRNNTDRVVYVLETTKIATADETVSPLETESVVLYRPHHFARRVASQGGVLTAHPDPSSPFAGPGLQRWVIRARAVWEIHLTLVTYGITEALVFADLDGLSRHLNMRFVR